MKIILLLNLAALLLTIPCRAQSLDDFQAAKGKRDEFYGKDVMSDISFQKYHNFMKEWHWVNTDFRKDTKRIQVIYANDIAWKALQSAPQVFPKGAMFGKIIFHTQKDPGYGNSIVPKEIKSYELMLRDAEKYKDSDGWGYAVFTSDGVTPSRNPKEHILGCMACHRLVPERGYIFTKAFDFQPFTKKWLKDKKAGP